MGTPPGCLLGSTVVALGLTCVTAWRRPWSGRTGSRVMQNARFLSFQIGFELDEVDHELFASEGFCIREGDG